MPARLGTRERAAVRALPAWLVGLALCACGCDSPSAGQHDALAGSAGSAGSRAAALGGAPASGGSGAGTGGAPDHSAAGRGGGAAGSSGSDAETAGAPGRGAAAAGGAAAASGGGAGGAAAGEDDQAGVEAGAPAPPAANGGEGGEVDSFEASATLDSARYEVVMPDCSGTGSVTLDQTTAHAGLHSIRVDGAGGFCNHVFVRRKAPLAAGGPVHVRVFVKVKAPLAAGHTTFAAMHDVREDKDLRLGGQNEVLVWNRESDDATLPELSPTGVALSRPLTADAWHCLEWQVDPARRAITTWLDDEPVAGLTLDAEPTPDVDRQWQSKADWLPQLTDLRLGWESYGDQANTVWFDELAVSTARIGCAS